LVTCAATDPNPDGLIPDQTDMQMYFISR